MLKQTVLGGLLGLVLASTVLPDDLDLGDPATLPPPRAGAVGYPSRDPNLDALPGFANPPPGYGVVPFYWWVGDTLTKQRISWELEQLRGVPIMGFQINYAHDARRDPYPSDPPLFSKAWWELFRWFQGEAKRQGAAVSLSDYILARPGAGYWLDEIIKEDPTLRGRVLRHVTRNVSGPSDVSWNLPDGLLSVVAYRLGNGVVQSGGAVDLRGHVGSGVLRWKAPAGTWKLVAVSQEVVVWSIDPMNRLAGKKVVEKFFRRFENCCPGESGKGLNCFFSDELQLGINAEWINGTLWTDRMAEEFRRRKGYDVTPELPALFMDIGPRTPKVRLDYRDVMTSLGEEGYFRPLFQWNYEHGMLFGSDHGGRGRMVTEFGDYFRTQRWMLGAGHQQESLAIDALMAKVNSSINHLYQRPRTWLEGYHSSRWGCSSANMTDLTFRSYVLGDNLLGVHGLYYTTHGGFWEWAPPCNFFRMPYWPHMKEFFRMVERLSYLLSQGVHRCDVAVMYPAAPIEAGICSEQAVATAFRTGDLLFGPACAKPISDFDYMDFQSLERAKIAQRRLHVSGEAYRVLVLPAMSAVRHSTMQKALDFYRAGGMVIAIGLLPGASERVGRNDPELDAMVREVFGVTAKQFGSAMRRHVQNSAAGGTGLLVLQPEEAADAVAKAIVRDFCILPPHDRVCVQALHRKIGPRQVYLVVGAPKNSECFFRAKGNVELWDVWTGKTRPLYGVSACQDGTRVRMPLESCQAQLIVFNPGEPTLAVEKTNLDEIVDATEQNGTITVRGYCSTAGRKTAEVHCGGRAVQLQGDAPPPLPPVTLDGPWEFELKPTMDNRFGDFRLPATPTFIGAEARRFRYADETAPNPGWQAAAFDDSKWATQTHSFGPRFWRLGPLPASADAAAVEMRLAAGTHVDPRTPVEIGGKRYAWQPYDFSMRWGVEGDPGPQDGHHGLKEKVSADFITLGRRQGGGPYVPSGFTYEPEPNGTRYYLWTAAAAPRDAEARALAGGLKPSGVWINGSPVTDLTRTIRLKAGANPLLLRYDNVGRGHFLLRLADAPKYKSKLPLSMPWLNDPGMVPYDVRPSEARPAGWYRFTSPPGLRSMTITARGAVQAWIDGQPIGVGPGQRCDDGAWQYTATVPRPKADTVNVALRVEQERGCYGGAALPEPISLDCGPGRMLPGDWSKTGALETYSGGAWYRKTIRLTPGQTQGRVLLDLGRVTASAEVHVNGQLAGIRIAPPWRIDISQYVRAGDNRLEILVYNTLANHYRTIPTWYQGPPESGLLGPVRVESSPSVALTEDGH
jgi:hypothetical protein